MKKQTKYALLSALFFAMAAITAAHAGEVKDPEPVKLQQVPTAGTAATDRGRCRQ